MTPRQISLVQASFGPLAGSADAVAQTFYAHLFQLDPLRAMAAAFTPELEQAWAAVYAALARAMRDGALAHQPLAA